MRKQVFGRKLKRDANERQALFKGLMNDLVLKESIQTTEEKAKSIKGQVEKLVTKAKRGVSARVLLQPYLNEKAIAKMFGDVAPRFASRPGGYTRIIKLGRRFSDNAQMAIIEWVEKSSESRIQNSELEKEAKVAPAKRSVEKVSPKGTSFKEAAESTAKVEKETKKPAKTAKAKPAAKKETKEKGK